MLSWDAVAGADYYNIYYDDFFDSVLSGYEEASPSFCEQLANDIRTTSYTHTHPDPDDNYYWVVACNNSGCSEVDSANPAGTVGTVPTTPTARYEWNGAQIVLSWDAARRRRPLQHLLRRLLRLVLSGTAGFAILLRTSWPPT